MLKAISRVSALAVLFSALFVRDAGAQIAPGVTQSAAQTATITGNVLQSDGTPVAGADVRLNGPAQLVTKSDAHGAFAFTSVPYGVYTIVANAANLGTVTRPNTVVKGDITVAIQYETQGNSGLKTIAHVSTTSAGAQINVTPASIASVNPSDYAFQGDTSWQQLLNQIPGVTVGGDLTGGNSAVDIMPGLTFFRSSSRSMVRCLTKRRQPSTACRCIMCRSATRYRRAAVQIFRFSRCRVLKQPMSCAALGRTHRASSIRSEAASSSMRRGALTITSLSFP